MNDFSAKQIGTMQKVSNEEWPTVRTEYREWRKQVQVIPTPVLFIVLIGSGFLAYRVWHNKGTLWAVTGWCLVMIAYYSLRALLFREEHWKIYSEGYESGHIDGVNKALGIDAESDKFIHEVIRDEEIDAIMKRNQER
jgi:hypothetical protein